jgi:hypothetical protein
LESSFRLAALSLLHATCFGSTPKAKAELETLHIFQAELTPVLSPLLAIEAELAWDFVLLDPESLMKQADARLRDILLTAVLEGREGILAWVAGAKARLPEGCIQGEAAWLLMQLCKAKQIDMAPVRVPSHVTAAGLIGLISDHLPTTVVGIQRRPGYIEFGPPSPARSVGIVLVETDPMIASIEDRSAVGEVPSVQRLELRRGEVKEVRVGDEWVALGNLAGQTFTLVPLSGEQSAEEVAADDVITRALFAKKMQYELPATVIRPVEAGYVIALQDFTCTAFMLSPVQELYEGDELIVVIDRVFPERRWISARLSSTAVAVRWPDRSSLLAVPVARIPWTVEAGDVFPGTIISHGQVRGDRRSAHVYMDPRCLLRKICHHERQGYLRFPGAVRLRGSDWHPEVGATVEILAAGIVDDCWQLRLRTPSQTSELESQAPSISHDARVSATVVEIRNEWAELEAPNGQSLYMSRFDVVPLPADGEPIPLRVGDTLVVQVLGRTGNAPSRLIASQRALGEPYLARLRKGNEVRGRVEHRLHDGDYVVMVDSIPHVCSHPFPVRTRGYVGEPLSVGTRVSAVVSGLMKLRWLIVVDDLHTV